MSSGDSVIDARTSAKAAGLGRWFRTRTIDLINRVVVALMIVGGLAVALSSRTPGAMLPAALVSFGVALVLIVLFIVRYRGIRRRLATDPAAEVARLTRKPGRHQSQFFAGGELARGEPRAGEFSEDFDRDAPDPYAALRNVDVLGQKSEASQDGLNRTSDSHRGEID